MIYNLPLFLSLYLVYLFIIPISGVTVQDALKENSIETTEKSLSQLKYSPESVWGYVEVFQRCSLIFILWEFS